MGKIRAEFKTIIRFLLVLVKAVFDKSISSSQAILTYLFIILALTAWVIHQRFPDLEAKYIPKLETVMNMDWWQLTLMVMGGILAIRILISPYVIFRKLYRENEDCKKQLAGSEKDISNNELELTKIRRELRQREEAKVVNIPDTLQKITEWYKRTAKEKETQNINEVESSKILTEFLGIEKVTDIIEVKKISRPYVNTIDKRVKKRMGLNKPNAKLDPEWTKRIYSVMDNNEKGLLRRQSDEYLELENQLKNETMAISETKLYQLIWEYVDNDYAAFSMKVFIKVGDIKPAMKFFPMNVRNVLDQLDEKLERASGSSIAQISHILEKYETGISIDKD